MRKCDNNSGVGGGPGQLVRLSLSHLPIIASHTVIASSARLGVTFSNPSFLSMSKDDNFAACT